MAKGNSPKGSVGRTKEGVEAAEAVRLQQAARAASTERNYQQSVEHFKSHGGKIPATVPMVVNYLAKFAGAGLAVATLQLRLIAIHRAHLDRGLPSPVMDPLVKRTMQGIRRTYGTAQRRVRAIVKDDLLELLVVADQQGPVRAARDRALLLIGFAGAFRRSELVGICVEDVTEYAEGIEVLLRRSKTDQEGQGRTVFIPKAKGSRCPVTALQSWLQVAGVTTGPVFRAVNRHDRLAGERALTPQSVALVVKELVRQLKGDTAAANVAGHSLRSGWVTSAATVGLQPFQIREVTGHRSDATLARYIRPVAKRKIPSLL